MKRLCDGDPHMLLAVCNDNVDMPLLPVNNQEQYFLKWIVLGVQPSGSTESSTIAITSSIPEYDMIF